MTVQGFQVVVPLADILSANDRLHYRVVQERKKRIRAAAEAAAYGLTPVGRATILAGVEKATAGRYDAGNLYPTVKVIVDVLVNRGVLADDDNRHVTGPFPFAAGIDRRLKKDGYRPARVRFRMVLAPFQPAAELFGHLWAGYTISDTDDGRTRVDSTTHERIGRLVRRGYAGTDVQEIGQAIAEANRAYERAEDNGHQPGTDQHVRETALIRATQGAIIDALAELLREAEQ